MNNYTVQGEVFGKRFSNTAYFREDKCLEDEINLLGYMYFKGNYSCDCNKALFADLHDSDGHPCGDKEPYKELKLYNGTEVIVDLIEYWDKYGY